MVSKKKVVTRVLKKHTEWGRGIDGPWGNMYSCCECGFEANASTDEELDDIWAVHVYSKIKKALKKRKKMSQLLKG